MHRTTHDQKPFVLLPHYAVSSVTSPLSLSGYFCLPQKVLHFVSVISSPKANQWLLFGGCQRALRQRVGFSDRNVSSSSQTRFSPKPGSPRSDAFGILSSVFLCYVSVVTAARRKNRLESQPKLNISEAEGSFEAPVDCLRDFMKTQIQFQTLLRCGPSPTQKSSQCFPLSGPVLVWF